MRRRNIKTSLKVTTIVKYLEELHTYPKAAPEIAKPTVNSAPVSKADDLSVSPSLRVFLQFRDSILARIAQTTEAVLKKGIDERKLRKKVRILSEKNIIFRNIYPILTIL